jgi:hypothetical protein
MSVAGVILPPDGYLKQCYAHVRAAGGICVADEVQVKFSLLLCELVTLIDYLLRWQRPAILDTGYSSAGHTCACSAGGFRPFWPSLLGLFATGCGARYCHYGQTLRYVPHSIVTAP